MPAAQSRGTSSLIRNEFDLVQAGFDLLGANFAGFSGAVLVAGTDGGAVNAYTLTPSTALTAYGTKMLVVIAPTITNTGAVTLNIAGLGAKAVNSVAGIALVSGDLVAGSYYLTVYNGTEFRLLSITKNYADQLAFSSVLPAQAGNGGKFVTTDGITASWAYAGISTVNSAITTSTTLAGTYLYVPVAMTTLGQSITLPAANTLATGGPQYIIDNTNGGYPVGIRNNSGTLLMAVAAGGEAFVSLKDNSTAAGVWSVTGTNLEPGLITIDSTFSSTYASTVLAPFVALDANTSIHFAGLAAGGFAAFVVDNLGKVLTTPVTVDASISPCTAFKIDATHAIVFYGLGTLTHKAVVLTLSGASPTLSLSVGTPQAFVATMGTAWDGENFTGVPKIAQLSGTSYVASYVDGTNTRVVAVSVAGAVITIGAPATIIAASSVAGSTTTYTLPGNTALVLYKSGASAPYANNAVVISVAGVVCTVNAPSVLIGLTSDVAGVVNSSVLLSPTKCIVADDLNSSSNVAVIAITITGVNLAVGAVLTVESGSAGIGASIYYSGSSATRYNPHLWTIGANTAGLWYLDSSGVSRAVVLTEAAGVVTAGAIAYKSVSTSASDTAGFGAMLPQGSTEFCSLNQQLTSTAGYSLSLVPSKISGSILTQGSGKPSRSVIQLNPVLQAVGKLSSGDYFILPVHTNGKVASVSIPVFRSNGDFINYRGEMEVPQLNCLAGIGNYGVSSNRLVAMGATIAGSGSTASLLRIINVEIAA